MTQEEKQLLLKDLCARFPYGVMVLEDIDKRFDGGCVSKLATITEIKGEKMFLTKNLLTPVTIEEIRPYLRPMSSMTEEEKEEMSKGSMLAFEPALNNVSGYCPETMGYSAFNIDYCNTHHFDYRGLIPMGLALPASEDMYSTKTE